MVCLDVTPCCCDGALGVLVDMLNKQCIQSLTINSQAFISAPTVDLALVGWSVAWRRLDGCLAV